MIAKGLQKLPTKDISVAMGPRTLISFASEKSHLRPWIKNVANNTNALARVN